MSNTLTIAPFEFPDFDIFAEPSPAYGVGETIDPRRRERFHVYESDQDEPAFMAGFDNLQDAKNHASHLNWMNDCDRFYVQDTHD